MIRTQLEFFMSARIFLAFVLTLAGFPAAAQADEARFEPTSGDIVQLYTYQLTDPVRFREGYRAHLMWHAQKGDRLVWYAWTIQSGMRRGLFVDGTAGARWTDLDTRPDLLEDSADFAANAGGYAKAVEIETWKLWRQPSIATPLEDRTPTALLDVFLLQVAPSEETAFERTVEALTSHRKSGSASLTWYRKLRGGTIPAYMLVLSRESAAQIGENGATLSELLAHRYHLNAAQTEILLGHVAAASVETWSYEPRLSLFPGEPLAP